MRNIRKILICYPQVPFIKGGTEILVRSLQEQLSIRKYDVDCISIPFQWIPKKEIIKNCMSWRLLDLTKHNGQTIDLIIATKFPSYMIKHPNKVTYLFHQFRQIYDLYETEYSDFYDNTEDRAYRQMIIKMDNRSLSEAGDVFTISKNVSERLLRYNNIRSRTLYPPPKLLNHFYNETYGDYVLYVGRLNRQKRIDLLIKAFSHISVNARCIIAGEGEERESLEMLTEKLNLKHKVTFTGYVDDKALLKLYANSRCVYYAPYDEDYGFTTIESLLSSKPIITTSDSGGVLEFIEKNITGIISENNPQSIASGIDSIFLNDQLCREMGDNGRKKVSHLNWKHVIENIVK